jgi:hypothetical protein
VSIVILCLNRFVSADLSINNTQLKHTMKKIIVISILTGWLAATSAFSQGYFIFSAGKSQVWDGFTTAGVSTLAATVNTTFLWAPANTVPTVASYLTSTPTNGNSTTLELYSVASVWAAILDGQFTLAVNNATSTFVSQVTSANGSFNYDSGFSFPVTGTTPGITYTIYEISWDAQYATPALAAAANGGLGSAVGWSSPAQYTPVIQIGTPPTMTALFPKFGTFDPVPEPATLALAGLGGLALLVFRRRKS